MTVQPAGNAEAAVNTNGHRADHGEAVFNLRHKQLSAKADPGDKGAAVHMADHGMRATS